MKALCQAYICIQAEEWIVMVNQDARTKAGRSRSI